MSPCVCLRLRLRLGIGLRVSRAIAPCSDSARLEAQTRTYTMCTTGDFLPRIVCGHMTLIRETFPLDRMVLTMAPKVNISVNHLELLIELVKQHPCIYDPEDSDHKDAIKVANIWASIRHVLHEDYQG